MKFNYRGKEINLMLDDEHIEKHIREYKTFYEHWMLDFIADNFKGGTWIDCGANFGNHTVHFSMFADKVISFEPVEYNHNMLIKNILLNSCCNVEPLRLGVGEFGRTCTSIKDEGARWSQCRLVDGEEIKVVPIDSFEFENVRLIKIDVEGFELAAVAGAMKTIERCKPDLFIEIWDKGDFEMIDYLLEGQGYTLIQRYNHAPTYHFSASGRFPVTYKEPI